MPLIAVDAETYCDRDLEEIGALLYARERSMEVLCWSLCEEGEEATVVEGDVDVQDYVPRGTPDNPTILLHWGQFDRLVAEAKARPYTAMRKFRPSERREWPQVIFYGRALGWLDLRQLAQQAGAPASVGPAAAWVGAEKLPRILTFSKPRERAGRIYPRDDQQRWAQFVRYAARDTEVLWPIFRKVENAVRPDLNRAGWRVVERMNMRGFPIDVESVRLARAILASEEPKLWREFERLTGGLRPTQAQKVAAFLGLPNCQKDTIVDAMLGMDRVRRRAAQIRLEAGSATRHKLIPLEDFGGPDARARYQFSYYGAWTRRLTASDTQPQNFKSLPEKLRDEHAAFFEALRDWQGGASIFGKVTQHIRGFVCAPPGKLLASVDFSQIELRVMAWLAGEDWLLDALCRGIDVYRITAGDLYGEDPAKIDKAQRDFGKMVELASQFGLSPIGKDGTGGLLARALKQRINIGVVEAEHAIAVYRRTHPKIVRFWDGMSQLVYRTLLRGGRHRLGRVVAEHVQPDLLRIIRPSGHFQCFWEPEVRGSRIEYTGRMKNGQMGRLTTYGAKMAQGVTQGTACDLLVEAMLLAESEGFPPVMSVHDEIIAEVDDDGIDHAGKLSQLLSDNQPEWSKGIPIVCDTWQERRFQ